MCFKIIFFAFFLNFARSDDVPRNMRNGRFLKFDTSVDGDIEINLELSLPFLKIPIKKMQSSPSDIAFPTIKVNIIGMALGGIAILGTTVLLPFLTKSLSEDDSERTGRLLDEAVFSGHELLELSSKFLENNNNIQDCTSRLVCLAAKNHTNFTSFHALKRISRNIIFSNIMNSTAIEEALRTGWSRQKCDYICAADDAKLNMLVKHMSGLR